MNSDRSDHSQPTADLPSSPAGDVTADMPPPAAAPVREGPGSRIGPYRILSQIGEGGFGVVFLAEQERPVARRVALKIIKLGMDTRQVVARFEQERQALALMDHPNIAKVFDAGATESGRPYFVMEFCPGEPIDAYCDRNRLTIEQRLDLFIQVCEAVQHAHTKAIIHRDIKPSNILVASRDGRLTAKVIDFGVAKATVSKLTEKTLFTEHRQFIGTPEYMSPEQAEGSQDIDTRTDVYSLGVLLYELLTGTTPFSGRELRSAGFAEILRIIREVEPPRPSTRLSSNTATLATVASQRQAEPTRIGSIVRGELDWIVMTAMEKDRARRYDTASALAQDVRRYLAGDAVQAVPPSRSYQFRKFVRRNRVMAGAVSAVAVALLLGAGAFAWQAQVAREQRDKAVEAQASADRQRDRAVLAEAEAKQRADELQLVADFQADMLAQVDPTEAGRMLSADVAARLAESLRKAGADDGARDAAMQAFTSQWANINATDAARTLIDGVILKPAAAAITARFADQPAVAARLQQALAARYHGFGMYVEATALLQAALDTRRRVLGEDHPDTLESLNTLGTLHHVSGRLAEAEAVYRDSLERYRRVQGPDHPDTITAVGKLGALLWEMGKPEAAERSLREALVGHRRVLGEEHPETLLSINNMGFVLQQQGKFDEAEAHYREALEKYRRVLGPEHPNTLVALNNVGYLLQAQNKLAEAEPFWRETLEIRRRTLGEAHPDTLNSINNMGYLLQMQGKNDEAEPYWREALDVRRRTLGPEHPDTLWSMNNLGGLLVVMGRLDEADPLLVEALSKRRATLGEGHPNTLMSAINLGGLRVTQRRFAEALAVLEPIEPRARDVFTGGNARRLVSVLLYLGKARAGLASDSAGYQAAETRLLEAQQLLESAPGASLRDRQECAKALSDLYESWHAADPGQGHDAKAASWRDRSGVEQAR